MQDQKRDYVVDIFAYGMPIILLAFTMFSLYAQNESNSLNNTDNTEISEEHLNADTTPEAVESVQKDPD